MAEVGQTGYMPDHLAEAIKWAEDSVSVEGAEEAAFCVRLAIAYAGIAIAERLSPPAETWSEAHIRQCKEEQGEL